MMDARRTFKNWVGLSGLAFALAVLIAGVAFFYRVFTHKPIQSERQIIADSIKITRSLKELHADSAHYYANEYEFLTYKADSLANLDSLAMDIRRAEYRANWEKQNRK